MMAAHKNAVVIANIRQKNQPLVVSTPGGRLIIFDTETREAAEARHNKRGWALTGYGAPAVSIAGLGSRASRPPPRAHRLSLHLFSILFSSIDFAATIKLNYIVLKNLLKSYLGKMTGELSKGYLARVNLREKGLESAEIILQVNQINPLGNGKYGLIVHDCQNQMKALLNSSMSGLVRGESLIDGTTRT